LLAPLSRMNSRGAWRSSRPSHRSGLADDIGGRDRSDGAIILRRYRQECSARPRVTAIPCAFATAYRSADGASGTDSIDQFDAEARCGRETRTPVSSVRKVARSSGRSDLSSPGFSGRKRYQAACATGCPCSRRQTAKIKVNPLALWSRERIEAEFTRRDLPRQSA